MVAAVTLAASRGAAQENPADDPRVQQPSASAQARSAQTVQAAESARKEQSEETERTANRAAMQLDEGALALERGDLITAVDRLVAVRQACRNGRLGRHALLLLGAVKLDPRNPFRNSTLAAEFLSHYLKLPESFPWTRPLAASLYALAIEMGGDGPLDSPSSPGSDLRARALRFSDPPIAEPAECNTLLRQAVDVPGYALPELDFPTVPEQIRRLERDRARLRGDVTRLEAERTRLRKELGETERLRSELARQNEEIQRLRAMTRP
ncbi:MAG TPA: hypothetical protein VM737_11670 [Gemmatimonadota bacterium]|nr:hypothetical protein [Gemmatimonadota bacterium]